MSTYTDQTSTFVYKGLLTHQQMDAIAENHNYWYASAAAPIGAWVPSGNWGPTGDWTWTPDGATTPITITQSTNDAVSFRIDTSAANSDAIYVTGKYCGNFTQDVSGGRTIYCYRNIDEAGSNALVKFYEDHVNSEQPVLSVVNDGAASALVIDQNGAATTGALIVLAADGGNPAANFQTNTASKYCLELLNDGNNANRYGMRIACGTDGAASNSRLITFSGGDAAEVGSIDSAGGVVSLTAFTGSHPVETVGNKEYPIGTVLILNKAKLKKKGCAQPDFIADISTKDKQKNVFAIYARRDKVNKKNRHLTFALGDGVILVSKQGGNIEVGDYLTTSNKKGHAMKQDDDLLHNYTIAKSCENVNWKKEKKDTKLIFCTYHAA